MLLTHAPHEQRVIDEHEALDTKTNALERFITGNHDRFGFKDVPPEEQTRMHRQLKAMKEYRDILRERIAAFPLPEGLARIEKTSGTVELDSPTDSF